MVVFPVKWLLIIAPWLMLLGGIYALFLGVVNLETILGTLAGGVWAYFQIKNRAARK